MGVKGQESPLLSTHKSLDFHHGSAKSPIRGLTATQARYRIAHNGTHGDAAESAKPSDPQSKVSYLWTSRNDRKGRHAIVVDKRKPEDGGSEGSHQYDTPPSSASWRTIGRTLWRMLVSYPVWDVSWLVAFIFTWGSIVWVLNAFFDFLPLLAPQTEFPRETTYASGWSAFVGATIFEFGSILLLLEAINAKRTACFGWAVEQLYEQERRQFTDEVDDKLPADERNNAKTFKVRPDPDSCSHHHVKGNAEKAHDEEMGSDTDKEDDNGWIWIPSMEELRHRYIYELGFLASAIQWVAATVFWISGFTAIPEIQNRLTSTGALDGAFWVPQVIGGLGFVISGFLFMLETQSKWYNPALDTLGWHIGAWNCIGGWGFFLCPCFGFNPASWAQYQSDCSTFWGSWAFLIGSLIQLYESLNKNPVKVVKK